MLNEKDKDFISLVKRMREAQKAFLKHRHLEGRKVAYKKMIYAENTLDEYLKKMDV